MCGENAGRLIKELEMENFVRDLIGGKSSRYHRRINSTIRENRFSYFGKATEKHTEMVLRLRFVNVSLIAIFYRNLSAVIEIIA